MAKFLKVVSTDTTNPEVLIGIDEVTHIKRDAANPNSEIEIVYTGGTCTVTFTGGAAVAIDVLKAFNAALVANPGGIVSTVGKPIATAQVPQQPSISGAQGRTAVTTAAVFVAYTGVAFA